MRGVPVPLRARAYARPQWGCGAFGVARSTVARRDLMTNQVQSACGLRRRLPLTVVAGALLMMAVPLAAQQTGSVTGRVIDQTTQQPIPFAQVSIAGTRVGGMTQADGRFLLPQVPAGAHTVRVELIGYGAREQSVTVTTGEPAVVNFELRPEALSLDAVVVTGTAGAARRPQIG